MFPREIIIAVIDAAKRFGVPPEIMLGITQKESSGDPDAWNPEPPYRYFFNVKTNTPFRKLTAAEELSEIPPADFPGWRGAPVDAEWWGQAVSWGLMQVMGGVAREQGFDGRYLTTLTRPAVGLEHGARRFLTMMDRHGKLPDALAAYNAGSVRYLPGTRTYGNQVYVDAVLAHVATWAAWLRDNPTGPK